MKADGSAVKRLTKEPGDDVEPAWSPDGTRIAFRSDRDGDSDIYVMNADGTGVARLTNDPDTDLGPAWSPDGVKIAFVSNRYGNILVESNLVIYVMDADGTGVEQLTSYPALEPAWAPFAAP
jgi:Tol biopolymer transport system component